MRVENDTTVLCLSRKVISPVCVLFVALTCQHCAGGLR